MDSHFGIIPSSFNILWQNIMYHSFFSFINWWIKLDPFTICRCSWMTTMSFPSLLSPTWQESVTMAAEWQTTRIAVCFSPYSPFSTQKKSSPTLTTSKHTFSNASHSIRNGVNFCTNLSLIALEKYLPVIEI